MGRVVHFEIHASDPERAADFYRDLFKWEIQAMEGPEPYWMIKTGAPEERGIDGGLLVRKGEGPKEGQAVNTFLCTVQVKDLDRSLEDVVRLGGRLAVPKMPIPGWGWLGYGKDPEGNIFGMMQEDPEAL